MADKTVTIRALVPLRATSGKRVDIGSTTEVSEAAAQVLVKNKQAELVVEK